MVAFSVSRKWGQVDVQGVGRPRGAAALAGWVDAGGRGGVGGRDGGALTRCLDLCLKCPLAFTLPPLVEAQRPVLMSQTSSVTLWPLLCVYVLEV